jgi:hypothetical protein
VLLCAFVLPLTSAAFRNNDQASILSGALQIARGQASFWRAPFFAYDKTYGTYLLLAIALRFIPNTNPVALGNIFEIALLGTAMVSLAFLSYRSAPPWLLLVPLLCPALTIYAPFLGTASVSFAFLLIAFVCCRFSQPPALRLVALALVGIAASCRADVVLAMPAFLLSSIPRNSLRGLLGKGWLWLFAAASIVPTLCGRLITLRPSPTFPRLPFIPKVFLAFVVFALGVGAFTLIVLLFAKYAAMALQKPRWRLFYTLLALSAVIPLGFYLLEMVTPRHFLLVCAVLIFLGSSRRTARLYRVELKRRRRLTRAVVAALVASATVPWLIGVSAPSLSRIRPTLFQPTGFPTTHGRFPMGAYAAFIYRLKIKDHFRVDHNQRIWLSASSVDYHPCPTGEVPLLETPMVAYLELAVRLQNKAPLILESWKDAPCGTAYVDARSVTRSWLMGPSFFHSEILKHKVSFVSRDATEGEPILLAEVAQPQSKTASLLVELQHYFAGQEFEIFSQEQVSQAGQTTRSLAQTLYITLTPPYHYVLFSDVPGCHTDAPSVSFKHFEDGKTQFLRWAWDGSSQQRPYSVEVRCPPAELWGWAQTVLPVYLSPYK